MSSLRVVLVRPQFAGNLGAVARVMHNFGFCDLVLVEPLASPDDPEARRWARRGAFLLENVRIVSSLDLALEGCALTAATSASTRGVVRQTGLRTLRELAPRLNPANRQLPVAVVFGPESDGLTTAEIDRCHYLITIPTIPAYSALNLAQAVAITLYEISQAEPHPGFTPPPAPNEVVERALKHLSDGLAAIHFVYGEKGEFLMHALRHLIKRAEPSVAETKILHGLARQMLWIAQHRTQSPPD